MRKHRLDNLILTHHDYDCGLIADEENHVEDGYEGTDENDYVKGGVGWYDVEVVWFVVPDLMVLGVPETTRMMK